MKLNRYSNFAIAFRYVNLIIFNFKLNDNLNDEETNDSFKSHTCLSHAYFC